MPEPLVVLLDQNVPRELTAWLWERRPDWRVLHTSTVGLGGLADSAVFDWAQANGAIIVTFDEDFADQRSFPVGRHHGVVRLRVWPTTIEQAKAGLGRLLDEVSDDELRGALVIVDRHRIRLRPARRPVER